MALLFRLVMILSLAGYSVSTVNAAMHGPDTAAMQHDQSIAMMDHGTMQGDGGSAMMSGDHHNMDAADHDSGVKKLVSQECCNDFCLGMAVLIDHDALGGPVVDTILTFLDDNKAVGQTPLLHRPPNI